ncbi:MAG TPA: hypothetical protein DDW53_12290 [Lachnoclostridium sp.]|nr:hypothetical protein [Lachnoclostridium sp.]
MLCKAFQRSFFLLAVSAEWENEIPLLWLRNKDRIKKAVIITKNSLSFAKINGMDWTEWEKIW